MLSVQEFSMAIFQEEDRYQWWAFGNTVMNFQVP